MKVTLSGKGQIAIPVVLRRRYGLQKGDRLLIEEAEGAIILRPLPRHPLLSLRGKYRARGGESLTSLLLEERRLEREDEAKETR
ncbi:AbrB/MazE/SpoVT family DNA-binding domain-containing protein [Thermodesulfitimonas sp.]